MRLELSVISFQRSGKDEGIGRRGREKIRSHPCGTCTGRSAVLISTGQALWNPHERVSFADFHGARSIGKDKNVSCPLFVATTKRRSKAQAIINA